MPNPSNLYAFPSISEPRGMTLRAYFASEAMKGLCSHPELGLNSEEWIAESALAQADAMLEALEKRKST